MSDFGGKKRSELPDKVFGIPQERKYPMPDEKHTRSAIKLFNHVEPKYEEQLAKAIIKNMKKYNIDGSVVGPNNRLRKYLPKDMIKENYMFEGYFKSDKDIYYNKDKFDSGEINLCFITGLSGSGKSTMGKGMSSKDVEHYEMDNVICNDNFSDNNLKEYGGLIESFFKGSGKSFRLISGDDNHNDSVFKSHKNYEKEITQAFVKHAISYCKSHKETKYVCDGIWIFMFIKPEQLKDCAVYIKGTSSIKSGYRALKRDIDEDKRNGMTSLQIFKREFRRVKEDVLYAKENQKELKSFRSYFEKQLTNESYIEESSHNKVYHEDKTMYYMTLNNISKNSTKESFISEGYLKSDKDIYYNKDKFDSGEINLCFITGHSGSGKSTMGRNMSSKNNVEHYELDDLNQNYKFTDEDLKKYGDLIYSFFKGPGKKYRYYSFKDMQNCTNPLDDSGDEFDKYVNRDFIKYAMTYAKSHKNTKYVIEGIWIYFFIEPSELKDYAVYIKGTSRLISAFRAARRDSRDADTEIKRFLYSIKGTLSTLTNKYSIEGEKSIKKYRDYYSKLQATNESYISERLFGKKVTDEEMKKATDEIIDFIKPIVMTPTNKTRAKNIGLKLQCSIENIDKNIICILILDGPQDRRDTDDARSILENIRYRVKSSLSPLVSKIDMGDGDEGCLYFTVNTKHVRKISESGIHENEISETEIDDIKTVISSLDDDSFNDFKFSDIVYSDIRYRSKKPIAFITIRTKLINNYTVGYVSLAVDPEYQNQGIGKSLTQKAVQWFKQERGIAFLEWHCLPDNEASRELANSAGFKEYIAKDHNDYVHYTMESVIQDTNIISKNKRTFSPDALDNAIKEYGTTAGTMVGSNQPDSVYIVNYMQNNAFSGHKEPRFGICKKGMKDLHIVGGKYNKFHHVSDLNKFRDESSDIHVYRYKGKPKTSFYDIVREMDDDDLNIYKFITGRDIDDRSSIEFDGDFIEEECFLDEIDAIKACTEAGLLSIAENTYSVPILTEMVQGRPYNYYRDINGVFIQNEITHIRSKSYDSIDEIPYSEITLVKRGYLV